MSESLTERPLPLPAEKTSGVSSSVVCVPGTVLTGASLTCARLIRNDSPTISLPAPSVTLTLKLSADSEPSCT